MFIKWGKFGWLIIAAIVVGGLLPARLELVQAADQAVVINELAWAGSTQSSNDEWIELKNLTDAEIDVGGWELTKNAGEEALMLVIPPAMVLPASGYFIISNYGADESALAIEPTVVDTGVTLSNSQLQIKLYAGDWSTPENLIDTAGDGGAPAAGDNTTKASMERDDDLVGWHMAMVSTNFDEGLADLGTPGTNNSQIVLPPNITSISPTMAETDGVLEVESIVGDGFSMEPAPTVLLKLGTASIAATNIQVATPELIDAGEFDLTGATTGQWDLVLTNPDGQTATLPQAVEIVAKPPEYDMTTTVRINEVYPRPNTTSNDEFIELYNYGSEVVSLTGWRLDDIRDGGSSPIVLDGRSILPKQYLSLYKSETKLTLNDNGDAVYLLQPDDTELDYTHYIEAPRGQTWARFDDGWKWTSTPTPNGKNVLSQPVVNEPDSPAVDEPDDPTPAQQYHAGDMVISELLPNPKDDDEFIELYNATQSPINLKGWALQDKSKRKYTIHEFAVNIQAADGLVIQAGQYVVVTQTMSNIALNNTGGETVTLLDPAGETIAAVSYPDKAPADAAYAWLDNIWTWTPEPTPGRVNILALDEADEPPPAVEVVLGETLPVTGVPTRKWLGGWMFGIGLGAIVCWIYANYHHQKSN